jgi:hypothetical protein
MLFLLVFHAKHNLRVTCSKVYKREPYISELNVLIKECHPCVKCNTTNTFILNLRSILDPSTVCCGCGCDCNCLKTLYTFEHVTRSVSDWSISKNFSSETAWHNEPKLGKGPQ